MNIMRKKIIGVGIFPILLFTVLIVVALIGTGAAQVSQSAPAAPAPTQHLTHKQAARLINTASTPADHHQLAEYFRQEAQRKRDKEQYYMETATTYRLHPPRVDIYRNVSTPSYHDRLADEARDTAFADDELAIFQDEVAKGLAQPKSVQNSTTSSRQHLQE